MGDSTPPSTDEEEITGVTHLARKGHVIAVKVQQHDKMIRDLQTAVMGSPDGKTKGISHKMDAMATSWTVVKILLGALFALMTLSVAAYAAFHDKPPSAHDIAVELQKQR